MAIMQVSRKIDYALRAVIHLANEEASARACSVGEIAERERVPRQFLEKIVQELIHKGLVRSRRGPHGGYVLARPAEQMTFRDVIEAVEGPISLNVCTAEPADCSLLGTCGMERVWREGQRRVMELFESTTIADVRRPRIPPGAQDPRGRQLFHEAEEWIEDADQSWLFSFQNICDVLGLDADYLRRGLRVWKEGALEGRRGKVVSLRADERDELRKVSGD